MDATARGRDDAHMNTDAAATVTTSDVQRMATILATATVELARRERISLPAAYAYTRRAFAAKWPTLATIVPATLSQLIGHDAAMELARTI